MDLLKYAIAKKLGGGGSAGGSNEKLKEFIDGSITEIKASDLEGVTKIRPYCFTGMEGLENVEFPADLEEIGDYAFDFCYNLQNVVLPPNLKRLGEGAFEGCESLTSITLPASLEEVGYYVFADCYELKDIDIPNIDLLYNTPAMALSIYGYDLYIDGNLVRYDFHLDTIDNIPEGFLRGCVSVEDVHCYGDIGWYAFEDCLSLLSAYMEGNTEVIGGSAFAGCESLSTVSLSDSVKSIGQNAFYNCNNLGCIKITDIAKWCNISGLENLTKNGSDSKELYVRNNLINVLTIPDTVTSIPDYAFYNCNGNNFQGIEIPNTVEYIGKDAFHFSYRSGDLFVDYNGTVDQWAEIDFGGEPFSLGGSFKINGNEINSVNLTTATKVQQHAFDGFDNIYNVQIGGSVSSIGYRAFSGCMNLTSVVIGGSVTEIGADAFFSCKRLTSVVIGDNVTTIEKCAFQHCTSLTSIVIPDTVTSIGYVAFGNCTMLESFTCKATTPPTIMPSTFLSVSNDFIIYVPAESVDAYKSATNWSAYADRIQAIEE